MAIRKEHEIYKRRFSRNVGLAMVLVGFVCIVFGLTVVKVMKMGQMQAFDHVVRPELIPAEAPAEAGNGEEGAVRQ